MADPISILAIAGLVYAGRKLSKPEEETYAIEGKSIEEDIVLKPEFDRDVVINDSFLGPVSPLVEPTYTSKEEVSSFAENTQCAPVADNGLEKLGAGGSVISD